MASFSALIIVTLTTLLSLSCLPSLQAQLSSTFYDATCPNLASTVRATIQRAVSSEPRMAASLIRLHFHDCFVMGCDASIMLDETSAFESEKNAAPNRDSVRGYEVIEAAKLEVERICPGVVSCADILTLAARDSSVIAGGPSWTVRLGRRDSTRASVSEALRDLPPASFDLSQLIRSFENKNLNLRDLVALSGAHTLGLSRCDSFRDHIYSNRTYIDPEFARTRRSQCPQTGGDDNMAPLDSTPNRFDNDYFRNLQRGRGLLHSDQVLFNGGPADSIVSEYVTNPKRFESDFVRAMIKMSEITPTLGDNGIIRRVCNAIN